MNALQVTLPMLLLSGCSCYCLDRAPCPEATAVSGSEVDAQFDRYGTAYSADADTTVTIESADPTLHAEGDGGLCAATYSRSGTVFVDAADGSIAAEWPSTVVIPDDPAADSPVMLRFDVSPDDDSVTLPWPEISGEAAAAADLRYMVDVEVAPTGTTSGSLRWTWSTDAGDGVSRDEADTADLW